MVERNFKNFSFNEFTQDDNGTLSIGRLTGIPNINSPQPPGDISTWFLGTRAENGPEFKELIGKAVDHIIQYRQEYLPGDPETITKEVKISTFYGWETVSHPSEVDYTPDPRWVERIRHFSRQYVPGANGSLLSTRRCLYTMTPDKHFIIDRHPEHPQMVFAAGFSGHGFKFSTLVGKILSELLLEGETKHDISLFKVSRFQKSTTQNAAV